MRFADLPRLLHRQSNVGRLLLFVALGVHLGGLAPAHHWASASASAAPPDLIVTAPPGLKVNAVSPSADGLFWERLTLENRTAFTLDFENKTGQPLTFTGATAFLLDDNDALLGTAAIDDAAFAAGRTISGVSNLFIDGRVLTNLATSTTEGARGLGVDSAGFITAGVGLHGSSDSYRIALVRYTPNGAEDVSFAGSGKVLANVPESFNEGANALVVDSSGRIVVAGFAEPVLGQKQFLVARFLPNGSFDPSFNGTGWRVIALGGAAEALAVAVDGGGRIVAGGAVVVGGGERFALVRLLDDGALDPAFGGDGIVDVNIGAQSERLEALALDAFGRIVTAGRGSLFGSDVFVAARYTGDGALDPTFGIAGATLTLFPGASSARAFGLVISPSGRTVVAGEAIAGGRSVAAVARYDTDGTLDANFGGDGRVMVDITALGGPGAFTTEPFLGGYARAVTLDPIGRLVLTGPAFTTHGSRMAVIRLNGIGQLDASFGGDGTAFVAFEDTVDADSFGVVSYTDDTIVVVGTALPATGGGYFAAARLKPNGTRYSVLEPEAAIPNGARVKLPFPFHNFPRKLTPATINVRVFFAEFAQPLFITGIKPIFFEKNARPYRFPLRNPAIGVWRAGQGHDIHENHYSNPSQRYAYDLSVFDPELDRWSHPDCDVEALIAQYDNDPLYEYEIDPEANYDAGDFAECSLAYGEPIVAAAAGAVVRAQDGSPNNFPVGTKLPELYLESSNPAKISGGGNAVVINHGNGEYTFYAHMRPGSVQVMVGQQVAAGQVLGEVGNTGSSSGTHLHFHLMDSYIPAPSGPPGLAQPGGGSPGHGLGLPIYFYDIAFPAGGAQPPLRQLRSGFNSHTMVEIDPEPVPVIDPPAPQYGPGNVTEVEPNDSLENAQRLVLPVKVNGAVSTFEQVELTDAGDGLEDAYRFRLQQGGTIVARLTFGAGHDLDLLLVNNLLHPFTPASGTRLRNPEVVVANLPAGTYYAFVSQFDGSTSAGAQYTLEIEVFGGSIVQLFDSLPRDLWRTPGHRQFALVELNQIQREVAGERFDGALRRLQRLRERFDGCARGSRADNDDLIRDCEAQRVVRELLDQAAADLDPLVATVPRR